MDSIAKLSEMLYADSLKVTAFVREEEFVLNYLCEQCGCSLFWIPERVKKKKKDRNQRGWCHFAFCIEEMWWKRDNDGKHWAGTQATIRIENMTTTPENALWMHIKNASISADIYSRHMISFPMASTTHVTHPSCRVTHSPLKKNNNNTFYFTLG